MSTPIGSFAVNADQEEVDAFRAAIRLETDGAALPVTFPMRWLVRQEIRDALVRMVPEPDLVLVHESQTFDYKQPLEAGRPYTLTLTARRHASPDRLIVLGDILDAEHALCAQIETILRLFSTKAAAA